VRVPSKGLSLLDARRGNSKIPLTKRARLSRISTMPRRDCDEAGFMRGLFVQNRDARNWKRGRERLDISEHVR
jgi:hypothetical protein